MNYYEDKAQEFFARTDYLDISELYDLFVA